MTKRIFLFCMAALSGAALHSQSWEVYDMTSVGLPSNTVRAIAHQANGTAWVGTDWGLCSYDGSTWTTYQVASSPLPDNDIRALAVDASDRLWIGTFSAGLIMKDGASWTIFNNSNSGLPEDQVKCIDVDSNDIWVGTIGGLAHYNGIDWRVYDDTPNSYNDLQLPSGNIAAVRVRDDGLVAIGTVNGGFTYLTDTLVQVFSTTSTGLPDNTALGVAIDDNGDRWVACPSGALLRHTATYTGNLWFQYSTITSTIPSDALRDVTIDALDRIVVGTQNAGVAVFEAPATWINYNMANSDLPDNDVNTCSLAPSGKMWFGTALGGAAVLDIFNSVEEMTALECRVWPNPVSQFLQVSLALNETFEKVEIVNSFGTPVLHLGTQKAQFSVDVSGLSSGVYLLRGVCGNSLVTKKIEIVRN